jgi:hypothetical protein
MIYPIVESVLFPVIAAASWWVPGEKLTSTLGRISGSIPGLPLGGDHR